MPGNEVGDRIHNFLGQESLSQGQHHSQVIDSTWPGLSNNLWVGSQRQVGGPLVSSLKNFGVHQLAESDRGHSGQPSSLQYGLNVTQSGLRREISRSQSQNQSPVANGYMQGHQAFQARQNETNFLGVDTASRGLSFLDSQIGNGPDLHNKNSLRLESAESPVNYDFFGGQQQISGPHPGMIQPLPRQQSGMTDMQLLQQHAILKQMQEIQRQQLPKPQFQLPQARQLHSANQVPSVAKQVSDSLSPAPINGVPVHDASNYSWQPEHMTPNANWLQHGASPAMQGSSGGFMFSPEQGQVRLMGLVTQQVDQPFYGISAGGARGDPYQYSSVQMDKPLMQQVPASSNSFPGNQYTMFSDQVGLQDGTLVSRQGDQGKNVFGAAAGQGLSSVFYSENLQQMTIQPKNAVMQESHGRQEHPGLPETSLEKSAIQAASSQNVATLDPTEEKILFGSDDSVWDIFGKTANMGSVLDGTDSFGAFPSLQSGSWSALMQSAVAETSSNDIGVQEEWSGLGVQNSEPPSGNMPASIVNDGSKQQLAWADNNLQNASTLNSKPFPMSTDANINLDFCSDPGVQQSGVQTANEQTGRMHNDSSQRFVEQLTEERSKWLDRSPLQKPVAESAQLFGNFVYSPDVRVSAKSISGHQGIAAYDPRGQPHNKPNAWNFFESASHSDGAISKSQDIESLSRPSQNSDHRGSLYEERGHGSGLDRPVPDANIKSGNVNSGLGSPQVNRDGSDLDNVVAITDSGTTRVTKESSQQLPDSQNLTLRKSIDSKVNSGLSRVPEKYQQNQDKSPHNFDSSGNNCLDKGVNSLNSFNVSSEVGRKGQIWLGPTASVQSSIHGASHGDIRNNVSSVSGQSSNKGSQHNLQSNVSAGFTSDYPYLKSHLQSQHVTGVVSQVTPNESVNAPFGGLASQLKQTDDSSERGQTSQSGRKSAPHIPKTAPDNDVASSEASQSSSSNQKHTSTRDPGQHFPVLEAMSASQPSATAESSQQCAFTKMPNVWTSVSAPEHLLGAQSSRTSQNLLQPHQQSNSNSETTLPGTKKLDDQIARAGGSSQSEFLAGSAKPQSFVGEEQPAKAPQVLPENDASQNPASMQRDIEAFGRSLRPNNAVHQNYSLLHQVQAMKNTEIDPSNRSVKRFKGTTPDCGLDAQQVSSQGAEQLSCGSNTTMRDAPVNRPLVPSGDSKMLSFLSNTGDNHETQLSSNDLLAFPRNNSQHFSNANNSIADLRGEHSQISPQIAPSWFDRYGTFKNGKMLPIYDAQKIAMMKATEKSFIVGRPSDSLHALHSSELVNAARDASQMDNARQSSNLMPIASEHISPFSLPPDITNQNLVVLRAKKRKSMTSELLPWHREVTQGSQRPQNISAAEVEWAHAANRLIEKVEDEPEMIEDWLPVLRSKRRLILTMQLIQQLLRAPPRVVLSADASKNYETVAYFIARSVLGDACSTAYIPESDTAVPPDSGSILAEKLKEERNQSILKAAEEFIIRAKMLENDLQSLDKRASILDLRVECQDLEKFSVINRFAKFHGRGQADGAETTSSSDAIASSHKFFPQRYVTALPMPRNLPDRVQCLSF
ncbi:hypothetical protein CRYUN_Cryun07bG0038000 [Craigia yunnanensis]